MAESFPISVLVSAAQGILNGLIPLATQQANQVWGFKGDVEKLTKRLTMIQALLGDAENPRIQLKAMEEWLKSIKAVTSNAENVLDEIAYEALRRKFEVQIRMKSKVRNFFSLSNPLAFRIRMTNKVGSINSRLDGICNQVNAIGLSPANQLINASVEPREFRLTHPCIDDSKVVGRELDVSAVRGMLLSSIEDDITAVAIVGMAGLGKTTLAKLIYKDEEVVKNFGDYKMWVCVSDDFRVARLLDEMVQSLTGRKSEIPDTIAGLVKNLEEKLRDKRFLVVLDDVWNTIAKEWESMIESLVGIGGSKGSKILITTRSMDVVSKIQTCPTITHQIRGLSAVGSWTMFRKRAFGNGGPIETETLEDIGRRMVEKCKGVPLAINSLGALLSSKRYANQWEYANQWNSIEESEKWRSLDTEDGILPVLRLSFDHLPHPCLKQCFAHCSFFPKDTQIKKDKLIQLWMGLGYLQPSPEIEMEDVGNDYFTILLHNSLLQDVILDVYGNVTSCKMHDLVHDLALDVLNGNCKALKASEVKNHPEIRHLPLCLEEETELEVLEENVGKLRTLFLTGHIPQNTEVVKYIRALGIRDSPMKELPRSILMFIHLRYLDLSKSSMTKVPDFITKLYRLETLWLPSSLQELPKEFHKLVDLRHLCFDDGVVPRTQKIPTMVGHLTSLRTLPFFVVGDDRGHSIEELGNLSKLRGKFKIYDLQKVKGSEEARKANMLEKTGIQQLAYHWAHTGESDARHEDVLEGLQPHKNINGLILEGFGGLRFASWMRSTDTRLLFCLVRIELRDCKLCEEVPTLGHLLNLEVLEMVGLDNLKCIGPQFYGLVDEDAVVNSTRTGAVFPALRKLILDDMKKLETWSGVSSKLPKMKFFPRLEELCISECPKLITIPAHLLSIQCLIFARSTVYRPIERKHIPCLTINLDVMEYWGPTQDVLMEDLLDKSSKSLKDLEIGLRGSLDGLRYLPKQLLNLAFLESLNIGLCHDLIDIIEEEDTEEAAAAFNGLTSLRQLSITHCWRLRRLRKGLLRPTLVTLEIVGDITIAHPDEFRNLTFLKDLIFDSCPIKEELLYLTSLQTLTIEASALEEALECFPWGRASTSSAAANAEDQHPLISLQSLHLLNFRSELNYLPDRIRHLTGLRELEITGFEGMQALPEWLGNLSSLQSLIISVCTDLMSLPSMEAIQRLTNLQSLAIYGCKHLERRCEKGTGEEWPKIAHIPSITISEHWLCSVS